MADWFFNLPVPWMALIVFVVTFVIAGGVYFVVTRLAETDWAAAFKAVSPGLLPVLGFCALNWLHRSRSLEHFR